MPYKKPGGLPSQVETQLETFDGGIPDDVCFGKGESLIKAFCGLSEIGE
jgi:hypothetical protein